MTSTSIKSFSAWKWNIINFVLMIFPIDLERNQVSFGFIREIVNIIQILLYLTIKRILFCNKTFVTNYNYLFAGKRCGLTRAYRKARWMWNIFCLYHSKFVAMLSKNIYFFINWLCKIYISTIRPQILPHSVILTDVLCTI